MEPCLWLEGGERRILLSRCLFHRYHNQADGHKLQDPSVVGDKLIWVSAL